MSGNDCPAETSSTLRLLNLALYDFADVRQAACYAQGGHASVELTPGRLFDLMRCLNCGAQHVVVRKGKYDSDDDFDLRALACAAQSGGHKFEWYNRAGRLVCEHCGCLYVHHVHWNKHLERRTKSADE